MVPDNISSIKPAPAIPARPNDQQSMMTPNYGSYGPNMHYGANPGYYGMNQQNPYGMPMFSGINQIGTTFQSIQTLVQAFSHISMMLESTYMAVNSSFRAVMEVGDHFIRIKDGLSGALSITSIFDIIKYFYRRVLYMFNLVNQDQIWSDSLENATNVIEKGKRAILDQESSQSSWPMLMFLGVAIGAPYMMYKFQKPETKSTKWMTKEDSHYIAEALYDFETTQPNEIPLKAGQRVIIAPKQQQPAVKDWLLATTDGQKSGLVPMNYVKIKKFEILG